MMIASTNDRHYQERGIEQNMKAISGGVLFLVVFFHF